MTCYFLRLKYLEGPGAPELELLAPPVDGIGARFEAWLLSAGAKSSQLKVVRNEILTVAQVRLVDEDGNAVTARRAADIMVHVRRCLENAESSNRAGGGSEPSGERLAWV